ncbi:hypothetical protein [Gluconobacter cerinus]|uniref:hypothetical protein n=1 Tax=Gluconobacter cerinus TaxID=38307 RepID=UPI00207B5B67|nr:hypothetical protein [Gluconobacter cerinus]
MIRSLTEAISDKVLQINVRGNLAAHLTVASGRRKKTPGRFRTGVYDAWLRG